MILVEFYLTLEQADTVPDDAAKGYGRNASLARAGAEGAKPCATATSHTHTFQHHSALLLITHTSAIMTHPPAHLWIRS